MEIEKTWKEISPEEVEKLVNQKADIQFVDVREQEEYQAGHIPGVKLIPVSELENRKVEIDPEKEVVLICRSGKRSSLACNYLASHGYKRLNNMTGGMLGWQGKMETGNGQA